MQTSELINTYYVDANTWDEMYTDSSVRDQYKGVVEFMQQLSIDELNQKEELAKRLFMSQGITFTVYSSGEGIEKIFPFDIIPRIITASEWKYIEEGIKQRLKALNLFLKDVYNEQFILKDGVVPVEMIYSCPHYLREMHNFRVPHDIYVHIAGIDLIRNNDGSFYILEDNLRTPSGVSYMLENREITKRIFPDLLPKNNVRTVTEYPNILHRNLVSLSPRQTANPTVVLLTPGIYNSAYFEHTTLARLMGVELVEGRDLVVDNHRVYMKTTSGLQQVDVIYRRVDDDYLDPLVFNPDSILGVPGLMGAYLAGNVTVANAVGAGIADDKAIYTYVPDLIKFYLQQEPLLQNVPTYRCRESDALRFVLERLDQLVVKEVNGSGGYGMLVGPHATAAQREVFAAKLKADPTNYIAQPTLALSTCPASFDSGVSPRHVDLRPVGLSRADGGRGGPGGPPRGARQGGSLVVNSSQGGGTKDTWVVDDDGAG